MKRACECTALSEAGCPSEHDQFMAFQKNLDTQKEPKEPRYPERVNTKLAIAITPIIRKLTSETDPVLLESVNKSGFYRVSSLRPRCRLLNENLA